MSLASNLSIAAVELCINTKRHALIGGGRNSVNQIEVLTLFLTPPSSDYKLPPPQPSCNVKTTWLSSCHTGNPPFHAHICLVVLCSSINNTETSHIIRLLTYNRATNHSSTNMQHSHRIQTVVWFSRNPLAAAKASTWRQSGKECTQYKYDRKSKGESSHLTTTLSSVL